MKQSCTAPLSTVIPNPSRPSPVSTAYAVRISTFVFAVSSETANTNVRCFTKADRCFTCQLSSLITTVSEWNRPALLHSVTPNLSPPPLPPAISTRSRLNGLRCVRISTFLLLGNSSSSWLLLLSYIITFFAVSFRRSLSYLKPLSPPPQAISTYSIPVHLPGRCTYSIIYSSIDHRGAARRLGANLLRA